MIVNLLGYSGSGKNAAASHLLSTYPEHFDKIINVSDVVRQYSKGRAVGTDVVKSRDIATQIIKEMNANCILVGLRELFLYNKINSKTRIIHNVYIKSDEEKRVRRMMSCRGLGIKEIVKKDLQERQIGITELLYSIGNLYHIRNDSKKDYLYQKCDAMMTNFIQKGEY